MKKWEIKKHITKSTTKIQNDEIVSILLENRHLTTKKLQEIFLSPPDPYTFTAKQVGIDEKELEKALTRIEFAITHKESIVVYADYDADGISAGTVLWETLHALGANVMPYIPHRFDEGYGLSTIGIDRIKQEYNVNLIITVDQGITGWEKVAYAKSLNIDCIVTDHHSKPDKLPACPIVHTTDLCGAGVSWFLAKTLWERNNSTAKRQINKDDIVAIAAIGTVADMVPLIGPNRSITKYGLENLRKTKRLGLVALMGEAGLSQRQLTTYDISHVLAPRLNAMGRLEHAMDALRLLCTTSDSRAHELAGKLGSTNKERQQLTQETAVFTKDLVYERGDHKKQRILFIAQEEYNQGIIGLVAGKLVEEFYLPSIVIAKGELVSKASARSIAGFNITQALRECSDILIDVGGHPMAAGFTIETAKIELLQQKLQQMAMQMVTDEMLVRILPVDLEIPLSFVSDALWQALRSFEPFGFGNSEPVFVSRNVKLWDVRRIGNEGKHIKCKVSEPGMEMIEAVAFGFGERFESLLQSAACDIAYTIDKNEWNGKTTLQLKIKDIHDVDGQEK